MGAVAQILGTVDRFLEYLGAVMKHTYLALTGAFLTLAPVAIHWWFPTQTAQQELATRFDTFSQPAGVILIFVATFRAWNEQKEIAEKASPDALRAEISELRTNLERARRREVTPEQGAILLDRMKGILRHHFVPMMFNQVNSEAEEYARQIYGYGAGFLHFHPTAEVPMELEGVFIRVKDKTAIPEHARQLSDALNAAGIEHEIIARPDWPNPGTMSDDYCDLTIGRKKSR